MRDYFQLSASMQDVRRKLDPFQPRSTHERFGLNGGVHSAARRLRRGGDNTILARSPEAVAEAHKHPRCTRSPV